MPQDNVEPHMHCLYAVWVPDKGWVRHNRNYHAFSKKVKFWASHSYAKKLATNYSGQLIVFDVTPTLRSWPSLEADAGL